LRPSPGPHCLSRAARNARTLEKSRVLLPNDTARRDRRLPPTGLEPVTYGLASHSRFPWPLIALWAGLSLGRLRPDAYSLYGTLRESAPRPGGRDAPMVLEISTRKFGVLAPSRSPNRCDSRLPRDHPQRGLVGLLPIQHPPLAGLCFPGQAPMAQRPLLYPFELRGHSTQLELLEQHQSGTSRATPAGRVTPAGVALPTKALSNPVQMLRANGQNSVAAGFSLRKSNAG